MMLTNTCFSLSATTISLFCTWTVLLCAGFIALVMLACLQRRTTFVFASLIALTCSYILFHVFAEMLSTKADLHYCVLTQSVGSMPALIVGLMLVFLTVVLLLRYLRTIQYRNTHITPVSTKEAADALPVGLCVYHESGQPFLVNAAMNELSYTLTNHVLLNGIAFEKELDKRCRKHKDHRRYLELADGRVYRISSHTIRAGGCSFQEILADDVTELHQKMDFLAKENARLQSQKDFMHSYNAAIEGLVRQKEVLKAKAVIHDEMNHLLLKTRRTLETGSSEKKNELLQSWQTDILLLCMQGGENKEPLSHALSDLNEFAKLIGINLVFRHELASEEIFDVLRRSSGDAGHTNDTRIWRLCILAAQEAMVNAIKHADAHHFYIDVSETAEALVIRFTNDGQIPEKPIREQGGLGMLRQKFEELGARMRASHRPYFALYVQIPKELRNNAL